MLQSKAKAPAEPTSHSHRLAAKLVAPDRYAAVFCLIILALVLTGADGDWVPDRILVAALLGINIVYALYISGTSRRWVAVTAIVVVFALLLADVAEITESPRLATLAEAGLGSMLVLITPIVIGRRLVHHAAITLETVAGALSIYLLLGIFFAYLYRLLDAITATPLFAQISHPRVVDYVYFSFVTMTTLGYGDLTPAQDLGRMLAVTEALFGQFYLVTVIALLVGRVALSRDHERHEV